MSSFLRMINEKFDCSPGMHGALALVWSTTNQRGAHACRSSPQVEATGREDQGHPPLNNSRAIWEGFSQQLWL